jgi:hypothetical protein
MDQGTTNEYGTYIERGLSKIGEKMSMTFTRIGTGDPNAMIRYTENPSLTNGAAGWGGTDGSVQLAPMQYIPDWQNPVTNDNIRESLIIHETLHVFGLDHDMDEGSPFPDEIMYPILPTGPVSFGNGDLTGMAFVKEKNKCGTGQAVTPPTTTPPIVHVVVPTAGTSLTAKQKCFYNNTTAPHKDIYKWKWNAKKKKCIKSRR